MAAVDTKSDVDTIEHLDFDPALTCEVRRPEACRTVAAFMLRCKKCSWSILVCEPHRVRVEAESAKTAGVVCGICRTIADRLYDLFELIPVGGRS
ncbi:hypothetical protein [Herbiconiux sp.]|uniref:hypothetical protein n=1 Tax=Herbiconiux sp. TaxID=1871186 RepID=UPI0025C487F5|nr:hypothetical protein [Herbiconiux sp.]